MIFQNFFKYQSLGNHFIIFDVLKKPRTYVHQEVNKPQWKCFVQSLCNRYTGVAADNVIVITNDEHTSVPEILIFNADGSSAQNCSNGLRCVAHHLHTHHNFPKNFHVKMGISQAACTIIHVPTDNQQETKLEIITSLNNATAAPSLSIKLKKMWHGTPINVGNPHFIIFEQISDTDILQCGPQLSTHAAFPHHTNVEWVWQTPGDENEYRVVVYERGCGPTQACGSGAAAICFLLWTQGEITFHEKIKLAMPGGLLVSWIDEHKNIFLQAPAALIFTGTLFLQ